MLLSPAGSFALSLRQGRERPTGSAAGATAASHASHRVAGTKRAHYPVSRPAVELDDAQGSWSEKRTSSKSPPLVGSSSSDGSRHGDQMAGRVGKERQRLAASIQPLRCSQGPVAMEKRRKLAHLYCTTRPPSCQATAFDRGALRRAVPRAQRCSHSRSTTPRFCAFYSVSRRHRTSCDTYGTAPLTGPPRSVEVTCAGRETVLYSDCRAPFARAARERRIQHRSPPGTLCLAGLVDGSVACPLPVSSQPHSGWCRAIGEGSDGVSEIQG